MVAQFPAPLKTLTLRPEGKPQGARGTARPSPRASPGRCPHHPPVVRHEPNSPLRTETTPAPLKTLAALRKGAPRPRAPKNAHPLRRGAPF
ncbi:hypothetical protein SBRY_30371 [Actinacidiphila bryophytorum]|uniref:Uncharacterized protein n=1 Tax=Actinacidiphila bryophytorum TaxID=1436133 RepID=A0A9W4H0X2_9ACTN|nr:hypothetical protein SBRY_30371 [Actinacidiphila bryophytorum]